MSIFNRALISIKQRFSKTIIIALVIFIISNIIGAAMIVKAATSNVEVSMKESLGAYATIEYNMDYFNNATQPPSISETLFSRVEANTVGESAYVNNFFYSLSLIVGSPNLKPHETSGNLTNNSGNEHSGLFDFTIKADRTTEPAYAKAGKIELIDGRYPSLDDNEKKQFTIAISQDVAKLNNLKVGDSIDLTYGVLDTYAKEIMFDSINFADKIKTDFEIVGIYDYTNVDKMSDMDKMMIGFEKNIIYTNLYSIETIDNEAALALQKLHNGSLSEYMMPVFPTYVLNSTDDIEAFIEENESLVPVGLKLVTSNDDYATVASSITNMKQLSNNIYFFGIIASIVILALLIIILLRERKVEFGIYEALGQSKIKTISQVAIEILIITVITTTFTMFSSVSIADKVSQQMINTQIENEQVNEDGMTIFDPNQTEKPEITIDNIIENYSIEITPQYIISIYIVVCITATFAVVISMLYILRQKPREILL